MIGTLNTDCGDTKKMAITKKTATDIALAYREIEAGEELLAKVDEALKSRGDVDIRDAFGRRVGGLELGVPSGDRTTRMFNVPWPFARPIIAAHIEQQRQLIAALTEQAVIESAGPR